MNEETKVPGENLNGDEPHGGAKEGALVASSSPPMRVADVEVRVRGKGAGYGASRVMLSPRERRIRRAGKRFIHEKLVPRALRRLGDLLDSKDERVARLAVREVLSRGGFPLSHSKDRDMEKELAEAVARATAAGLSAGLIEKAVQAALAMGAGRVQPIDAEFANLPPENGNGAH